MKKLIAFSVLFVLIASTAFAQIIRVRGELKGGIALRGLFNMEDSSGAPKGGMRGDDGVYDDPWIYSYFAPYVTRIRIRADMANESNTFGGFFRLHIHPEFFINATNLQYIENKEAPLGNIWWQPSSLFKATFGYFAGRADMIGKIYLCDEVILPVTYFGRYHPDRYNGSWTNRLVHAWGWEEEAIGFSMELFPMSGLYIVASLPLLQEYRKFGLGEYRKDGITDLPSDPTYDERKVSAWDILAQTGVRVAYNIRGLGQIVASWDGGTGTMVRYSAGSNTRNFFGFDGQFINAHLNLTAVKNLQASFGVEIPLPINRYYRGVDIRRRGVFDPDELIEKNGAFKRQLPYGVDIRAIYDIGDFAMGMGIAGYFGGYFTVPDAWYYHASNRLPVDKIKDPLEVGISVNPEYRFSNINVGLVGELKFTQGVNTGDVLTNPFVIIGNHEDRGFKIDFNIIPYVSTKVIHGGSAWAGLQIRGVPYTGFEGDNGTSWKTLIQWSVPVGIAYNF